MVRTVLGKMSAGVLTSGPRHFILLNSQNFPDGVKGWWWIKEDSALHAFLALKFKPYEN